MLSKFLERFGQTIPTPRFSALTGTASVASVDLKMEFGSLGELSDQASSPSQRDIATNRHHPLQGGAQTLGFLCREPVYSLQEERVIGHELRLNNSSQLLAGNTSVTLRAMHDELLLKSILSLNTAQLAHGALIFVRLSSAALNNPMVEQLPPHNVVLAVQPGHENIGILTARCVALREQGFHIALDDIHYSQGLNPLLDIADYLRFNIEGSREELAERLEQLPSIGGKTLIAIGANDADTLRVTAKLGFSCYQDRRLEHRFAEDEGKIRWQRARTMLLMNLVTSNARAAQIESALKEEGALVFRILRYMNSPANGLLREVHSISEILETHGHDEFYRCLSLMLFHPDDGAQGKPQGLRKNALLRGRLTELIGQHHLPAREKVALFVTGMFSHLEQLFSMPLASALSHFSLSVPQEQALLQADGPYAPFLKLAIACENRDQSTIESLACACGITSERASALHAKALLWAHEVGN